MFVPPHEHRDEDQRARYVPATCPIDGHAEGYRRTEEEPIKALACGFAR